jgi:uracil-DNA glycosylase family 4
MWWDWIWSCPYSDEGWRVWMEDQCGKLALQVLWEEKLRGCTRCGLHETRTNIVYGIGNTERPDLAFIGIGPGEDEDRTGEPFVGRAGKLLDRMIAAMKYERGNVYITNCVMCRPPGNRDPEDSEINACFPSLLAQLVAVRPRVIVALGALPGNILLRSHGKPVSELRKKWHAWSGTPLQVTYHPAGVLRDDTLREPTWEDLRRVLTKIEQLRKGEQDNGPLFAF